MSEQTLSPETLQFFDPFAEVEQQFVPDKIFSEMIEHRYGEDGQVNHDYSLDSFLEDYEALQLDTQYVGNFAALEGMMERMAALCQHDHALGDALANSLEKVSADKHDDHDHGDEKTHDSKTCKRCSNGKSCPNAK